MADDGVIPKVRTENLKVVRMWKDDIDEMVRLIEEATAQDGEDLIIEVNGEDLLKDVSHLSSYQGRVKSISVTSGSVRLYLGAYPCQIVVRTPDLKLRGMMSEIVKIADRCMRLRFFHKTLHSMRNAVLFTLACVAVTTYLGTTTASGRTSPSLVDFALIPVGALVAIGLVFWLLRPLSSVLHTRTRHEAPPFWQRKKDDLLINLTSLMIGGVIGYYVNMFTK
ncbi:hypothetical protein SAMN04488564_103622 [Lentzea waywayandensis]|uniref:Uncharacterized protein n=1 Tax=Lentzea waywayandensis TaxID=84724 RepID=A0A1I6E1T1_9PSEU|nr:hypothetical protein [Lentzea waywayandensis]SFR11656.1 hypothetical protein SAMN04488564_103622 [Lentzea waywayandensis]